MGPLGRVARAVFAGDRRVWRAAAIVAVPLVLLAAYYCLRPRFYFLGTDSVEDAASALEAPAGAPACEGGLRMPAGTAVVRLEVFAPTAQRPPLRLTVFLGARRLRSQLPALAVPANRPSNADFPLPSIISRPAARLASVCVTAAAPIRLGGRALSEVPPDPADARRRSDRSEAGRLVPAAAAGSARATCSVRATSSAGRRCFAPASWGPGCTRCCCSRCSPR